MQQQQQGILSSFVNELSFWEPPMTPERLKEDAMLAQKASRNDLWLRSTSSERLELQQSSSRKDAAARSQSTSSVQAISEPLHWKVAVDAVSGRKYYYDSVTRNTQWEKVRFAELSRVAVDMVVVMLTLGSGINITMELDT
jgi:hypothetical protein